LNIFVTVGSRDYPFNRLIKAMDKKGVFMQIGKSTAPKNAKYKCFLKKQELDEKMQWADLIVGHGGTATVMDAIDKGKKIIIVPRQKKFNEHIDDHQIVFSEYCKKKHGVPVVYDVQDLWKIIKNCPFPKIGPLDNRLVKEVKNIIEKK
jgi:UDP-N-acetylglucosamine transferase subunit ALG13